MTTLYFTHSELESLIVTSPELLLSYQHCHCHGLNSHLDFKFCWYVHIMMCINWCVSFQLQLHNTYINQVYICVLCMCYVSVHMCMCVSMCKCMCVHVCVCMCVRVYIYVKTLASISTLTNTSDNHWSKTEWRYEHDLMLSCARLQSLTWWTTVVLATKYSGHAMSIA